ncbi:DNA polymerase I [Candidatus Margulisiibacteriota bacterium]
MGHDLYPEYKAHRPPSPEDFLVQMPILKKILEQLGMSVLEKPGFEADDLIGTITAKAEQQDLESMVMTADRDFLQLASSATAIMFPSRKGADFEVVKSQQVFDKYGLTPKQMIDLKALEGDTSDNIPGVPGVGEKTALNLLHEFHDLEQIFNNLENINSESVRKKLDVNRNKAFLSYKLGEINRHVPLDISLDKYEYNIDWEKAIDCFDHYKFTSLANRFRKKHLSGSEKVVKEKKASEISYPVINNQKELTELIQEMKKGFAIDLETTSLDSVSAQIVGVAIATGPKTAFYIALNKYLVKKAQAKDNMISLFNEPVKLENKETFKLNPLLKSLKPILEDPEVPKFAHNGKYEYQVLRNYGIELQGLKFDTMIAAYLLFPGERIGLKSLAYKIFDHMMTSYEDVAGKGRGQINFSEVTTEIASAYAGADADFTFRLKEKFEKELVEHQLQDIFYQIEMPLVIVLAKMEYEGVCVDKGYLNELDNDFSKKLTKLEKEIYQLSDCEFNLNSPKQLQEVLFDKLQLPSSKLTKTGRSTDSSVLENLKTDYPIAEKLLGYRTLEKLRGTYVRALPQLISPKTNRIHTSFNQTITLTGRLSSSNPNLQNIPIRTEDGKKLRNTFIPSNRDRYLLSADYSQIELRVLAHLSQDENMIKAFNNGEDIHSSTAALVFGVPLLEVSSAQRQQAKAINFGIIYGQSVFGLSRSINISRNEAKEIIDNYFHKFPSIRTIKEETIKYTSEHLLVKTEFGRIRPIPDINSLNPREKQFAERAALNTRIQGTAADLIKIAMINIQNEIENRKLKSRMIIQVHDELVFDVVSDELDTIKQIVCDKMENAADFAVPLTVDINVGKTWRFN